MKTDMRATNSHGPRRENKLRRDMGLLGLTFAVVGSIIGSGWLLGALSAAEVAGPASVISWILGAAIVGVLALVHAEFSAATQSQEGRPGSRTTPLGGLAGFIAGWMGWIYSVTLAPIEVEAALQYATNYLPGLTHTSGGVAV